MLLLYYNVTWKHWCHVKPKILWLGGIYVITQSVTVIRIVINEKCNFHTEWIIAHRGAVVTLMTAFHQTIIWKVNNEHSSSASKQYLVAWNLSLTFIFVSLKTQIYSLLQRWLLKCQQTLYDCLVVGGMKSKDSLETGSVITKMSIFMHKYVHGKNRFLLDIKLLSHHICLFFYFLLCFAADSACCLTLFVVWQFRSQLWQCWIFNCHGRWPIDFIAVSSGSCNVCNCMGSSTSRLARNQSDDRLRCRKTGK